ncbi:acyl-CoA dehydrogenase family protein [Robiginitomaculum antarcticum]|uniref:acyl-CoA dehydrogenase family protein n=1 Tax=Robiginitomaculum antarcticum TaxID=437507 RepID=UPI00037EFFAE|nr:acyl-CoA dehydrogenase family protein [Robiginitomaculum antarcticum]
MDIYTDEHRAIAGTMRKIIEKDINPYVDQWEKDRIFPAHDVFKKLGDAGLLGIQKPEKYGGMGLDYTYQVAAVEALGAINCAGIPMAIGVQTDMATPALAKYGSEALCNEFLVPAIAGDMVACIGVSEPSAGSDVAAIKTKARKDGDDYIINGGKMWITNSYQADFMVALCNTSDGHKHSNKSLIVIPMETPGVVRAKKLEKIGNHSSDTGQIFFEDVRVPQANLIGTEGAGFMYQMQQFEEERLWAAVSTLPGLQACIDETIEYTRQREVFGKPILDNQVVHYRLAELQIEVELYRALVEKCVTQYARGENITKLVSMLKVKSGRLLREVTDACLQYWGGMGYMDETLIARRFRDGRLASIGGGADEVMLGVICKMLGTLPGRK